MVRTQEERIAHKAQMKKEQDQKIVDLEGLIEEFKKLKEDIKLIKKELDL